MHSYQKNVLLVAPPDSQWAHACISLPEYGYILTHVQGGPRLWRP